MQGPTKSLTVRLAANGATALFAVAMVLQLLLAAGIVPISMAWGGRQPILTLPLRCASLAAAALLGLFGYVIRRRAGLLGQPPIPTTIKALSWVVTAFLVVNTLGNLASASAGERMLFAPLSLLLAVACLIVSGSRSE